MLALLLAASAASPGFLASETVTAREVRAVPSTPGDPAWAAIPAGTLTAHAQRTIRLLDRDVNKEVDRRPAVPVTVRAAHDSTSLAILLEWPDETESRVSADEVTAFGDAAAIEIPERFGEGRRLPYVGMGDDGEHVRVYMQRAVAGGQTAQEYVAAGFGSLTRAPPAGARMTLQRDARSRTWRALFVRPLVAGTHSLKSGLVPFAVALWDGARRERSGYKALTSWKFLRLARFPASPAYVKEMSFGHQPGDLGDVARGKMLVEALCLGCHHMGDRKLAPPGFAPDLSGVGVVATYAYLRDSLLDPGQIVVPEPNVNRHVDRSAKPGPNGDYPSNPAFQWGITDPSGKRISKMTPFGALPKEDIASIVAFLKTLGETPPELAGGRP